MYRLKIRNKLSRKSKVFYSIAFVGMLLTIYPIEYNAANNYPDAPSAIDMRDVIRVIPRPSDAGTVTIDKKNQYILSNPDYSYGYSGLIGTREESNKLDLTNDFSLEAYIYQNGNTAGMTFVMHNDERFSNGQIHHGSTQYIGNLAVYNPQFFSDTDWRKYGVLNAFVVEFDNEYGRRDLGADKLERMSHVAYTFPGVPEGYFQDGNIDNDQGLKDPIGNVRHNSVQYVPTGLADGKWRLFKVNWKASNRTITYQLEGLPQVSVKLDYSVFNSNKIHWGFTGTLKENGGGGNPNTNLAVAIKSFKKSIASFSDTLVAIDKNNVLINDGGTIPKDSELTYLYGSKYEGTTSLSGSPTFSFYLDKNQEYIKDSFKVKNEKMVGDRDEEGFIKIDPMLSTDKKILLLGSWQIPQIDSKNPNMVIKYNVKDLGTDSNTTRTVRSEMKSELVNSEKKHSYNIKGDTTPPTGKGKVIYTEQGNYDLLLDTSLYATFFANYEDDVTEKEKIKIMLTPNQDLEKIVSKSGESLFKLRLVDEANNSQDIDIPIFIYNSDMSSEWSPDEEKVRFIIEGQDSTYKDEEYPKTQEILANQLQSKYKVWKVNEKSNVIDNIENNNLLFNFEDLPEPGKMPESGEYEVKATYKNVVNKKKLFITSDFQSIIISLVDEKNSQLKPNMTIKGKIGDKINLNKNKEIEQMINQLEEENYTLIESPEDGDDLLVLPEQMERSYVFKGNIKIKSVPSVIDFGQYSIQDNNILSDKPIYDNQLIVWDTRIELKPWKLMLKEMSTFQLVGENDIELSNIISYHNPKGNKIINNESQEVFTMKHSKKGEYNISKNHWEKDSEGLQLKIPEGVVKQIGEYKTTLIWQLEETY